jgi:TolB protein
MRLSTTRMMLFVLIITALCACVAAGFAPGVRAGVPGPGQIAATITDRGNLQIAVVNADGSGLQRLTTPPGHGATPVWSPDGRWLAFTYASDNGEQLHIMNIENGDQRRIIALPDAVLLPAWAPDGSRLAFARRRAGGTQIAVVGADGRGEKTLTAVGENTAPAWSSDGQFIAFIGRRDHELPELYVMRSDGSDQRRLTTEGVLLRPGVLQPVWIPASHTIAFVHRIGRAEQEISLINADGSGYRRLATGYAPSWSADGREVTFVVSRVAEGQIYAMHADITGLRRLTEGGTSMLPGWSPDARSIAFLASRDGDLALWVMKADGSDQRRLAPAAGDLSQLPVFSWRPR